MNMNHIKHTPRCIYAALCTTAVFMVSSCADSAMNSLDATNPPATITCEEGGKKYLPGEDVPLSDGCNTCFCSETGELVDCTLAVCWDECNPEDCGPQPLAPNYLCDDGLTMAGPGSCEMQPDGACGWSMVSCPDTCTPGEIFEADNGCNTCVCPDNGKKSEANCDTAALCPCTTDLDCGSGATELYCMGDEVIYPSTYICDTETGACIEDLVIPGAIDCSLTGQICEAGQCVDDDSCVPGELFEITCNTCYCPESGKKSEAPCDELACECESDSDCLPFGPVPGCVGTFAYPSPSFVCNTQTYACEPEGGVPPEPVDCALSGQVCELGQCVNGPIAQCIPGETFPAADGCNTCTCPNSGLIAEADCTQLGCFECVEDADCGVVGFVCIDGACVLPEYACIPGAVFNADDGCNTCTCPESGLISEAICTQMGCADCLEDKDCGAAGFICVEGACVLPDVCSADIDCGVGTTQPYCIGDIVEPATAPACNVSTGQCYAKAVGDITDCAAIGETCQNGHCVPLDLCNSDVDCGSGATPPYCEDDVAHASTYPMCDIDSGQCITAGGGTTDCAALGLTCDFGECVTP